MMNIDFSNSLTIIIIYEKKTKEITTMKEVWICDPNYQKIWQTFALKFSENYYNALRAMSNTRKSVSSGIQTL